METINNISINDDLWLVLTETMLSFRLKGMEKDIHFTIAYNAQSPDINLHVTRNTGDANDKPRIEIARMDKDILKQLVPGLSLNILNAILVPIDIRSSMRKCRHAHYGTMFIPMDGSDGNAGTITESTLISGFGAISKVRKNRLKIKGDVEQCIKGIIGEEEIAQCAFLERLTWLPKRFKDEVSSGFIITKKYKGIGVRIGNRWFSMNAQIGLADILRSIMPPELARHLIFKTRMSYERIKNLETYMEAKKYCNSMRLTAMPVNN